MLKDNYAEYTRNKTRGIPRPGEALLHGIVYCGECGHKMVVQYKKGTQYICNSLRQQYESPLCQRIPGNPVDQEVVKNFFQAISPIELDAYTQTVSLQNEADESIQKAHRQQLDRLRYQTKLAERQFNQVDPDNRLVASEIEKRWENSLRELRHAEELFSLEQQKIKISVISLPEELKLAFIDIGKNLPELWNKHNVISQQQKKSFLRCLIDKVVIHRSESDIIHTRIVWKGGDTTTIKIPVAVGSLSRLSFAKEMEDKIIELSQAGKGDKEIAEHLTNNGFRSPMGNEVLLNTVKCIRLKRGIFLNRAQLYPRRITGFLTISQMAQITKISAHWIYDRIHNGTIKITMTHLPQYKHGLYLFPDTEETIKMFHGLKNGHFQNLYFS